MRIAASACTDSVSPAAVGHQTSGVVFAALGSLQRVLPAPRPRQATDNPSTLARKPPESGLFSMYRGQGASSVFQRRRQFRLPERLAGSAQKTKFASGGSALDSSYRFTGFDERSNQQMNVVCHRDPGIQFVESLIGATANIRANNVSDPRHAAADARVVSR